MKTTTEALTYSPIHWDAVSKSLKAIALEAHEHGYLSQATVSNAYGLVHDALEENNIDLETVSSYAYGFLVNSLMETLDNADAIKAKAQRCDICLTIIEPQYDICEACDDEYHSDKE